MKFKFGALRSSVVLLSLSLASSIGLAGPQFWLTETALGNLNEEDVDLLKDAAYEALTNEADGRKTQWQNPETGHSGSIQVDNTQEKNGQTCRQAVVSIDAITIKGDSQYLLCLQPDGSWKIAS